MPSIDEEIKNLQLDRPGRGKSADQLKKHTVHEQFENKPVERALFLLTKGDEVQKISIIQQLPQLVLIDENATYTRILPKIQQELPTSSCEFHIHASRIFQIFMEKPKAPPNLLQAVLQGIESRDLIVVNAWLETLLAVIPTLSEESIRKEVLPIVTSKSNLTQPVMSRISASLIIGKIAIHPKFKPLDIKKDILPIAQSLCQDVQPEVRASICQQLPNIASGIGEELMKTHLLPCLVELASDNNALVKSAAITSTVNMMKNMGNETKKGIIIPLFKKLLATAVSVEDITAGAISKEIGELIKFLQPCLTNIEITNFLQFYKTLARRGLSTRTGDSRFGDPSMDVMCRDRCASNLPAILSITVQFVPEQIEQMYGVFRELGTDPCYIVRRSVGKCIHEIAQILGPQNKIMKPDIVRLLRDDAEEVLQTLVPNIGATMNLLCKHGVLSKDKADQSTMEIGRALLKCQLELTKGYNWRLLVEYLSQLEKFCLVVPPEFIHQHFTPVVLSNALSGRALPVRSQAIHTLLVFLFHNNKDNQQKWLRETLVSELCYSNSSYTRRLYILLCSHALEIFQAKYFKEYFFMPLIALAGDPISNIRYMFVNLLPQLNKMANSLNDPKVRQTLLEVTGKIEAAEKDVDVLTSLKVKPRGGTIVNKAPVPNMGPMNYSMAPNASRMSTRPSTSSSIASVPDMNFLKQHFYTDAGINLPAIGSAESTDQPDEKKLYSDNITVDELSENDIKQLEISTPNFSDDVKVNLRNVTKLVQKNTNANTVNKRHSSIYSTSCLETQQRKSNNRRSLNFAVREPSRIPVISKSYSNTQINRSNQDLSMRNLKSDEQISRSHQNLSNRSNTPQKRAFKNATCKSEQNLAIRDLKCDYSTKTSRDFNFKSANDDFITRSHQDLTIKNNFAHRDISMDSFTTKSLQDMHSLSDLERETDDFIAGNLQAISVDSLSNNLLCKNSQFFKKEQDVNLHSLKGDCISKSHNDLSSVAKDCNKNLTSIIPSDIICNKGVQGATEVVGGLNGSPRKKGSGLPLLVGRPSNIPAPVRRK